MKHDIGNLSRLDDRCPRCIYNHGIGGQQRQAPFAKQMVKLDLCLGKLVILYLCSQTWFQAMEVERCPNTTQTLRVVRYAMSISLMDSCSTPLQACPRYLFATLRRPTKLATIEDNEPGDRLKRLRPHSYLERLITAGYAL